jgi:hypothetical protein
VNAHNHGTASSTHYAFQFWMLIRTHLGWNISRGGNILDAKWLEHVEYYGMEEVNHGNKQDMILIVAAITFQTHTSRQR